MLINYKKIDNFEIIVDDACNEIEPYNHYENYILAYEITKESIEKNPLTSVIEEAKNWAQETRPENFFFNHGEYRKGGLEHISNELKKKPTSNRALYSLINQSNIDNSGDESIPSFMVFQCLLDNENHTLNCTVYFRALEVSKFLRVNLEEIRQNLISISKSGVHYNNIKLLIVSGRAHNAPDAMTLTRPEIDLLNSAQLCKIALNQKEKLEELLIEKAKIQTKIDYDSLVDLENIFDEFDNVANDLQKSTLRKSISLSKDLQKCRESHSHSNEVKKLNEQLEHNLKKLAKSFRRE